MKITNPYRSRQTLWGAILLTTVGVGLTVDALIFGLSNGLSVSEMVWAVSAAYPLVNVVGFVANLAYSWLVREDWKLTLLDGIVTTHLWLHPFN